MARIAARERLDLMGTLGTLLAEDEHRRAAVSALAHAGYPVVGPAAEGGDDEQLAAILESA